MCMQRPERVRSNFFKFRPQPFSSRFASGILSSERPSFPLKPPGRYGCVPSVPQSVLALATMMTPYLRRMFVAAAVLSVAGAVHASSTRRRETGATVFGAKDGGRDLPGASQTSRSLHEDPSFDISYHAGDPVSNSCADLDQSLFLKGQRCGAPLSSPCFDVSR